MPSNINFLPECFADTALLRFMKIKEKHMNHADGIHKVAKAMEKHRDDFHKKLIGLVDNDSKNVPRYFDDFQEVNQENDIIFKHKPGTNHYLITINPQLEAWLIESGRRVNITPEEHKLPSDPKKLHDYVLGRIDIGRNKEFLEFLTAIKRKESPYFQTLQNIINTFINSSN